MGRAGRDASLIPADANKACSIAAKDWNEDVARDAGNRAAREYLETLGHPNRTHKTAALRPFACPSSPDPPKFDKSSEPIDLPHCNPEFFNSMGGKQPFAAATDLQMALFEADFRYLPSITTERIK